MAVVHEVAFGVHIFHWLTLATPLAAAVAVSGLFCARDVARLILVGMLMTAATAVLNSVPSDLNQVLYGAPLPLARAGLDPTTGFQTTPLIVLRACLAGNLLFWCSSALILGALLRLVARGVRRRPTRVGRRQPYSQQTSQVCMRMRRGPLCTMKP